MSGWTYSRWRGDFYPRGLAQRGELAYTAERLSSVEINGSFYSLQRPTSYERWRDQTPDGFLFAVKGSRFITHMRRLAGADTALANFWASGVLALGAKLGPVLWQLPASLAFDRDLVQPFLESLPRSTTAAARLSLGHDERVPDDRALTTAEVDLPVRHVLEPRHASFGSDEAVATLRACDVGMVMSDSAGTWPMFDEDTSDVRYVRLHGHTELYASGYSSRSLDAWAQRCQEWQKQGRDVFVYFDNDIRGRAPWDAVGLLQRLQLKD